MPYHTIPCIASELVDDKYVLGRHPSCSFTFDDPVISNKHCEIFRVGVIYNAKHIGDEVIIDYRQNHTALTIPYKARPAGSRDDGELAVFVQDLR